MPYSPSKKIYLPEVWDTLTYDQIIAVYNGVGPDFFPAWIRRVLDVIYWWAADTVMTHDVEYTYGTSKIMADLRLLVNCIIQSNGHPRRMVMGLIAYLGVSLFGWRAWGEGHAHQKG